MPRAPWAPGAGLAVDQLRLAPRPGRPGPPAGRRSPGRHGARLRHARPGSGRRRPPDPIGSTSSTRVAAAVASRQEAESDALLPGSRTGGRSGRQAKSARSAAAARSMERTTTATWWIGADGHGRCSPHTPRSASAISPSVTPRLDAGHGSAAARSRCRRAAAVERRRRRASAADLVARRRARRCGAGSTWRASRVRVDALRCRALLVARLDEGVDADDDLALPPRWPAVSRVRRIPRWRPAGSHPRARPGSHPEHRSRPSSASALAPRSGR